LLSKYFLTLDFTPFTLSHYLSCFLPVCVNAPVGYMTWNFGILVSTKFVIS